MRTPIRGPGVCSHITASPGGRRTMQKSASAYVQVLFHSTASGLGGTTRQQAGWVPVLLHFFYVSKSINSWVYVLPKHACKLFLDFPLQIYSLSTQRQQEVYVGAQVVCQEAGTKLEKNQPNQMTSGKEGCMSGFVNTTSWILTLSVEGSPPFWPL